MYKVIYHYMITIDMKQIQLILDKKNPDPEQVSWLEVRYPNQNNRLSLTARYFFIFGARIGLVFHYD